MQCKAIKKGNGADCQANGSHIVAVLVKGNVAYSVNCPPPHVDGTWESHSINLCGAHAKMIATKAINITQIKTADKAKEATMNKTPLSGFGREILVGIIKMLLAFLSEGEKENLRTALKSNPTKEWADKATRKLVDIATKNKVAIPQYLIGGVKVYVPYATVEELNEAMERHGLPKIEKIEKIEIKVETTDSKWDRRWFPTQQEAREFLSQNRGWFGPQKSENGNGHWKVWKLKTYTA